MRLLIVIVLAVIGTGLWSLVKRNTDAREAAILEELDQSLVKLGSDDGHIIVISAIKANTRYMGNIVRSLVTFIVIGGLIALGSLAWLQDVTDTQQGEINRSCDVDIEFRRLIEDQLTQDLRLARERRDTLADDIANNPLISNVTEANERLREMDVDIAILVAQTDEIRDFNLEASCP
jgi:hypothetical protein